MKQIYKNFIIPVVIIFSSSFLSHADEIKMKCETKHVLSDNFTYFKYKSSIFSKKVLYRIDGNWIDLSNDTNLQEYKMGDLSSNFLVRKRNDWWLHIVLDFETKELQFRNCYNKECSGTLIGKGSLPCK